MKHHDVGFVTHKHQSRDMSHATGFYNVGIIYFSDKPESKSCLELWKNCVVDNSNEWYDTHGTCGDQKYLELFDKVFPKVDIYLLDRSIGHTAPWNLSLSKITKKSQLEYDLLWSCGNVFSYMKELEQKLIFHHFSHFRLTSEENSDFNYGTGYKVDWDNEWGPEAWHGGIVRDMYKDYADHMYDVIERYGIEYVL